MPLPSRYLPAQSQQKEHWNKASNIFKINNKDTRTTPMANYNFNNDDKVNKELSKMCKKEKLLFVDHSNINPKIHMNRSKLHLNRNGYEKLG